jgi:hypothetical protein
MGLKNGLLHLYVKNGDIKETAQRVSKFYVIVKSSIHVGNSDVVSEFSYKNSQELIDIIIKIKGLNSVERVIWSEEILVVPIDAKNIAEIFKKLQDTSVLQKSNGPQKLIKIRKTRS